MTLLGSYVLDVRLDSASAMKSMDANVRRGRAAMLRALLEKADVKRAMFRTGMGWVDFVWGHDGTPTGLAGTNRPGKRVLSGAGLAHIIGQRMRKDGMTRQQAEAVAANMVDTIAKGREVTRSEFNGTINVRIVRGRREAVLVRRAGSNSWLLTGWKDGPGSPGAGYAAASDTHAGTSHARTGVVAGQGNRTIDGEKAVKRLGRVGAGEGGGHG